MHLRKMAFGFGVITGAALTISVPYFMMKVKEMKSVDDDQENHGSINVKKIKDDIKEEFSDLGDDVNDAVNKVVHKMEKSLSSKKKKKK
ncbi:MAG: hypothetical protein J1F32_06960 [Erysipelotrichales bacterium]|nr:hypothetical protein [Erysipelotrichales bacterium]